MMMIGSAAAGACTPRAAPSEIVSIAVDGAATPTGERAAEAGADPPPAPAESAAPAASAGPLLEEPGDGKCRVDTDCVLTTYQEGCCAQGCEPYATSKASLAARQAKENCSARRGQVCPPPAPCPRAKTRATSAVCRSGTCGALAVPVAY